MSLSRGAVPLVMLAVVVGCAGKSSTASGTGTAGATASGTPIAGSGSPTSGVASAGMPTQGSGTVTSTGATSFNADAGPEGGSCAPLTANATVKGTLHGQTLVVRDVISVLSLASPDSGQQDTVTVAIVDYPGACALNPRQTLRANSNILGLHVTGRAPFPPGVYTVPSTATAQFATYDFACNVSGDEATAGAITVTNANACGFAGTFDLTLTHDHVTGSFVAPDCEPVGPTGSQCF